MSDLEDSVAVTSEEVQPDVNQSADSKTDGKRRKFKPLQGLRKLFNRTSRKHPKSRDEISTISIKSKSTTALAETYSDDDDDGGFKQKSTLSGSRSISEDSIFKPEQKDSNLDAIKKMAMSDEAIHRQSAFTNELYMKIKSRQTFSSDDDDEDDGLPHSPITKLTTADVIMGGGLQPLPGKSMSRESNKSLLSIDGSENEEEDHFDASWKSKVAGVATKDTTPKQDADMDLDFAAVKVSEGPLRSDAAKHKLSVRPKSRKVSSSKKIYKEKSASAPLPKLSEESPTKTPPVLNLAAKVEIEVTDLKKEDIIKEEIKDLVEDVQDEVPPKGAIDIPVSKGSSSSRFGLSSSPVNQSILSEMKVKKRPTSIKAIEDLENRKSIISPETNDNSEFSQLYSKFNNRLAQHSKDEETLNEEPLPSPNSVDSKIISVKPGDKQDKSKVNPETNKTTSDSKKSEELKSPVFKNDVSISEKAAPVPLKNSQKSSSLNGSDDTKLQKNIESKISTCVKTETDVTINSKSSVNVDEKPLPSENDKSNQKITEKTGTKSPVLQPKPLSVSSKVSQFTKVGDQHPASNKLTSPKEDYKQKRQGRSKTLPEQPVTQEILKQTTSSINDSSSKVQRSNSQGCELEPSVSSKPEVEVSSVSQKTVPKKLEGLKSVFQDSSSSSQPEWIKLAKKKQPERESPPKEVSVQKKESPSEVKPVSTSANNWAKHDSKKIELTPLSNSNNKQNLTDKKVEIVKKDSSTKTSERKGETFKQETTTKTSFKDTATISKTDTSIKSSQKSTGTVSSFAKKNSLTSSSVSKPVEIVKKSDSNKVAGDKQESTVRKNSTPGISKFGSVSDKEQSSFVSGVPAWRRDLQAKKKDGKKDVGSVNIEIIEKSDPGKKKEKPAETPTVQLRDKSKMESSKCTDTAANRSSVLDMVKNFQNFKVTS